MTHRTDVDQGFLVSIAFGILSDKKALIDGDATARTEVVHRHEVSLALVAGYLKKRGIEMKAIDVESTVLTHRLPQISESVASRVTTGDTPPPRQAACLTNDPNRVGGGGVAGGWLT